MDEKSFDGIILLTRVGTHLWKNYCESVATRDEWAIRTFDAALESIAEIKKRLEFDGKVLERRHRRFRAALLANAKRGV